MRNNGFTLIELLVVVLIIGILSAVALPQYEMSVAKSRYSGLMPLVKSIKNAQEVYWMANGSYATDWTKLDIDVPAGGTWNAANNEVSYPNGNRFLRTSAYGNDGVVGYTRAGSGEAYYAIQYDRGTGTGIIRCGGNSDVAKNICKSMGGKPYTLDGSTSYQLN